MEWNIAHRKLSEIGTEFNFKNYPVRNILSFLYVTEYLQKHAQKSQLTIRTFAHYNWNLHGHYFAEKNAVQKRIPICYRIVAEACTDSSSKSNHRTTPLTKIQILL